MPWLFYKGFKRRDVLFLKLRGMVAKYNVEEKHQNPHYALETEDRSSAF